MEPIEHPVFGELRWDRSAQQWEGWVHLPLFTAFDGSARKAANELTLRKVSEAAGHPVEAAPEEETEEDLRFSQGFFPLRIELPYGAQPQGYWARARQALFPQREPPATPTTAQEQAFLYLAQHEAAVRDAIARETLAIYRDIVDDVRSAGFEDPDELELVLPRLDAAEGIMKLMRLSEVTIAGYEKDGMAPVRFFFQCTWDEEHGCEVYALNDRISFEEP